MKYLLNVLILASTLLTFNSFASSEYSLVIVANTENHAIHVTRRDVRNLFMGGAIKHELHAAILPPDNTARILFNTKVVGLTEARIQSYWAQMRFSGRKKQPKEISTTEDMLEYLKSHKGAIAYLPAESEIPKELTIVLRIK